MTTNNHPAHGPVSLERLSLNDAIAHADERADALSGLCAAQHAQLAAWLRELQERNQADSENLVKERQRVIDGLCTIGETAWEIEEYMKKWDAEHATPQPAPERDSIRREHAEWSDATFGNVSPVGPLKHLSKEALEAAAEPGDLSEWDDMQFLLWDAQRRAGISDEQITQAMVEKLVVNKKHQWPEPKDGEPRLHIKDGVQEVKK